MSIDEAIMKLDLIASDAFEGGNKNEFIQLADWLRELKAYKKVRRILSQNRIATDRYGDVVLWDDIKRVLEEVNADE